MENSLFTKLLEIINNEREDFEILVNADNILGLNVSVDDILNYLEYCFEETTLKVQLKGNIIITDGDILSILKIIHDMIYYEDNYILYINENNMGTIAYLISRVNSILEEFEINTLIKVDYSRNYNKYLDKYVNIVGNENFVNMVKLDFKDYNSIIV